MQSHLIRVTNLLFIASICTVIGVSLGCGTVSMDLYTTVEPSGGYYNEIDIETTGMLGGFLSSTDVMREFRNDDWEVARSRDGDTTSLTASKHFDQVTDKIFPLPLMENDGSLTLENINFHISDGTFIKEYYFKGTIPGNPSLWDEVNDLVDLGLDDMDMEVLKDMYSAMFNMSWTL